MISIKERFVYDCSRNGPLQQILGRIDWSHHFPLCQDEKSTIDLRTDVMVMAETATAFSHSCIVEKVWSYLFILTPLTVTKVPGGSSP